MIEVYKPGVVVTVAGQEIYHGLDWYYGIALGRAAIKRRGIGMATVFESRDGGTLAILTGESDVTEIKMGLTHNYRSYADFMQRIRAALKEL
jgi:hypothetical protein